MPTISQSFSADHAACDEALATAEEAVQASTWDKAAVFFKTFNMLMERHFNAEETVLFPAFERATGMAGGPPAVMRMEHAQIRGLLGQMQQAVKTQDQDAYLGASETLLILMQQHNMKEEHILYPMCDQHVSNAAEAVAALEVTLR